MKEEFEKDRLIIEVPNKNLENIEEDILDINNNYVEEYYTKI